jgi:hypothetical protein
MPLYQADDIADVVKGTLNELGELKWTDIVSNLQEHVFLSRLLKKEKVGFKAGKDIQWNLQVAQNNSARMVALGQADVVNVVDTMQQASIPWRHMTASWAVIRQTLKMNREPRTIFNLLKEYRSSAMISIAELMETQGWNAPAGSTPDTLNTYGIPYWIVPNATQGFNGGNPWNFSGGSGGLSSTTYPNWSNYTDSYVGVTKTDFVRKWRRAAVFTNFMSPVNADIPTYNTGNKYGYYTTYYVLGLCEEILDQQNDNLGKDVASQDGQLVFRRTPVCWVPKLETLSGTGMSGTFSNATYASTGGYPVNPLFGINWGVFRPVFLESEYMVEQGPYMVPFQHTTLQTFVDLTWNVECRDRRRNFVLTQ